MVHSLSPFLHVSCDKKSPPVFYNDQVGYYNDDYSISTTGYVKPCPFDTKPESAFSLAFI